MFKKLFIILSIALLLVSCRNEIRSGYSEEKLKKNIDGSVSSKDSSGKGYKIKERSEEEKKEDQNKFSNLFSSDLTSENVYEIETTLVNIDKEKIEKALNFSKLVETVPVEYGKSYVYAGGEELANGPGRIYASKPNSRYINQFLNINSNKSLENIEASKEVKEKAEAICNKFFDSIGVNNFKLIGAEEYKKEDIVAGIEDNDKGEIVYKDGTSVNLNEVVSDSIQLKYTQNYEGLYTDIYGFDSPDESSRGVILSRDIYFIIQNGEIVYLQMIYFTDQNYSKKNVDIISKDKAYEIVKKDLELSPITKDNEIKFEGLLYSFIEESRDNLLRSNKVTLIPVYNFYILGNDGIRVKSLDARDGKVLFESLLY